jgi:hypothetical protein
MVITQEADTFISPNSSQITSPLFAAASAEACSLPEASLVGKKQRKLPAKKKSFPSPSPSPSLSTEEPDSFLSSLCDRTPLPPLDPCLHDPTVELASLTETNLPLSVTPPEECVKKRGRKPQGGKLIKKTKPTEQPEEVRASVILHLKCFVKDLDNNMLEDHCPVQPYTDEVMTSCYKSVKEPDVSFTGNSNTGKSIHTKIKELEQNLHTNNVNDKKSGCFHCTCPFDNTPYYIPKCNLNGTYQVYGCFCMPECAAAYLFKEPIDTNVKFDRYYMLNHIYGKANGYTQNIKLAPNPYYFLEKFYGNLNIAEYRSLFKKEKYYFMVDKPLTRVMPEIYEDNDTHIIHNKFVNANSKFKAKGQSKNSILHETFSGSH